MRSKKRAASFLHQAGLTLSAALLVFGVSAAASTAPQGMAIAITSVLVGLVVGGWAVRGDDGEE